MEFTPQITVANKTYKLVKVRRQEPVAVYRGEGVFLRIGEAQIIDEELRMHRNLLAYGFPAAEIITDGEHAGARYVIEKSLGEITLGGLFHDEYKKSGAVSDGSFQKFVALAERHARAQCAAAQPKDWRESAYYGWHVDVMIEELPQLRDNTTAMFDRCVKNLAAMPSVISHGDFNAFNQFENGAIDFEHAFHAPLGYDLAVNILQRHMFPVGGDFEAGTTHAFYFTEAQENAYWQAIDKVLSEKKFPQLAGLKDDFFMARMPWSTARMHKLPKLQKWRYQLYEECMKVYLAGGSPLAYVAGRAKL